MVLNCRGQFSRVMMKCSCAYEQSRRNCYAIYDFNLIEKHVCGNTAIPIDVNELTPQVIDDTLDGPLGETSDQPFVGSDLFGGAASHAVLVQVDHLRTPPSNQRSAV